MGINQDNLESEILKSLSTVVDPDLGQDIVSLGFVKNLECDLTQVSFDLELTTPACPVKDELKSQCENQIRAMGIVNVDIRLTAQSKKTTGLQNNQKEIENINAIIAVSSCKGGVGKSTVATNLAVSLAQSGAAVGILDADIYGPSLPTMFGVSQKKPTIVSERFLPLEVCGLKMMSAGFLFPEQEAAVLRGPMVTNVLQQILFFTKWGALDYLVIDMPPGTGDIQLTMTQVLPLTGAVIVTTPQKISLLDVGKGIEMFSKVKVPVLGVVENMSYMQIKGQEKVYLYGKSGVPQLAKIYGLPMLGEVPFFPDVVAMSDKGHPPAMDQDSEISKNYLKISEQVVRQAAISSNEINKIPQVDIEW